MTFHLSIPDGPQHRQMRGISALPYPSGQYPSGTCAPISLTALVTWHWRLPRSCGSQVITIKRLGKRAAKGTADRLSLSVRHRDKDTRDSAGHLHGHAATASLPGDGPVRAGAHCRDRSADLAPIDGQDDTLLSQPGSEPIQCVCRHAKAACLQKRRLQGSVH